MNTITRDEIYHRLERCLNVGPGPNGQHAISPNAPVASFLQGTTPDDLFEKIKNSGLFGGIQFPLDSQPGVIGIRDVQKFGDLIDCAVASYRHAGWQVT